MNESVIYLPEVDSTNLWAKHNLDKFGPIGAVYTTHQTAGRGRLGRDWLDAPHKGLYYTAVIKTDLVQPATLPLFASLAVCDALRERYHIDKLLPEAAISTSHDSDNDRAPGHYCPGARALQAACGVSSLSAATDRSQRSSTTCR